MNEVTEKSVLNLLSGDIEQSKRFCSGNAKVGTRTDAEVGGADEGEREVDTRRLALSSVLVAVAVALSGFYIPLGATKCFPVQHMINGLAGVLLGPWYAVVMALITGLIRNVLGLGTVYAFPGGIPGGLVVGVLHRYILDSDIVVLAEPLGTVVIGATLSAFFVAPFMGHPLTLYFLWTAFAASSIPGSILGFLILKALRRLEIAEYIIP